MTYQNSRRNFLKTASLGLAGIQVITPTVAKVEVPVEETTQKQIELAIATITCDGFGDENFERAFNIIPKLPYKNVEFNCWYGRNVTPSGIRSIKQRCQQHKLNPICMQGGSFSASGNISKDVAHKLWNMEIARQLGCKRVKFTGANRGSEGGLDGLIQVLKEIAPVAEEMDMLILLENHANTNIENTKDYDIIFNAISYRNVGMCMDIAHFDAVNADLIEVIDLFHSRILHIDLKETERKGIHKVVPFGQGVTDNTAVIEKMLGYGYKGYLLVEMVLNQSNDIKEQELYKAYQLFQKYER